MGDQGHDDIDHIDCIGLFEHILAYLLVVLSRVIFLLPLLLEGAGCSKVRGDEIFHFPKESFEDELLPFPEALDVVLFV